MIPPLWLTGAAAAVSLIVGAGSIWVIQDWRYGAKETERVQQELFDQQNSVEVQMLRQKTVTIATNAASAREANLRRDADGFRNALISLHDAAEQTLLDAGTSFGACTERAAAFSELYLASERDYGRASEKADRHASDVKTCHDSIWPK